MEEGEGEQPLQSPAQPAAEVASLLEPIAANIQLDAHVRAFLALG